MATVQYTIPLPLFRSRIAAAISVCPFRFRCRLKRNGIFWRILVTTDFQNDNPVMIPVLQLPVL